MPTDPPDDLQQLLDLARGYLQTHEEVRRVVGVIARAVAAIAESAAPAAAAPDPGALTQPRSPEPAPEPQPRSPEPVVSPDPGVLTQPRSPEPPPVPIASLPPLTFAPAPVAPPAYHTLNGDVTPHPLSIIAARCRLKAEACRYVEERGDDLGGQSRYHDLINRAKQHPDCNLWMLHWDGPARWSQLAAAFETAADAADVLALWWDLPEHTRDKHASDVLHAAAEAQAVLFAAVEAIGRPKPDGDQIHLFVTIREEAARIQVFVHKFLKREDRANPATAADVSRRLRELAVPMRKVADAGKNRHKTLANLRYKVGRVRSDPHGNAGEWPRISELLEELVAGGLPASNAEVRELVLPILDSAPDDVALSPGATRVFHEIDRYLASRSATAEAHPTETPSAEVAEVRRFLAGRQVVLIGGLIRPTSRDALIDAFGLDDLEWVTTDAHESLDIFEAPIARPEVVVVLLAIRWSSHSYGDVRAYCEKYGKLLVRLPAGYNPNQVAHQILTQVGDRLKLVG